jgi:Protein of unknown function (DUF2934).
MKVPVKKTTSKNANISQSVDLEEKIRRRAYDLYQQRGYEDGHDTDDWLQAEAELAREKSQSSVARPVKQSRKVPAKSTAKGRAKPVAKSGLTAPSKLVDQH